jgi:hypothetical protein
MLAFVVLFAVPAVVHAQDCKQVKLASPNGRGVMVDSACTKYEGEFRNGKLHGQGKMAESDGRITEGSFMRGQLFGPGKITYETGDVAEGEFFNGYLSGKGRYSWKDGRVFEGTFFDGRVSGMGRYKLADGTVLWGMFDSTPRLDGLGVRTNPDGSRLVGEFRNGEPFGEMLYVKPDGARETRKYAWGGLSLDKSAKPAPSTQPQGVTGQPPGQPSQQPKGGGSPGGQTVDEVNKAIRGFRNLFGK